MIRARIVGALWLALVLTAVLVWGAGCAKPLVIHGVPNLQSVRSNYLRSGQPLDTLETWAYLRGRGVTDVIKLDFEEEGTDDKAADAGIAVHHLAIEPTSYWPWWVASFGLVEVFRPDLATMRRIQAVIREVRDDGRGRVVLIHCRHGRDRTGLVSGMVLVLNRDMSKDDAWDYVLRSGFRELHVGLYREWKAFNPLEEIRP